MENVRQIFSKEVSINQELHIHWQQVSGPEQAVLHVEIDGTRIRRGSPMQNRIAAEFDDLLCRLFFEAERVLVRPLTKGQSTMGVLWAQPFYASGGGQGCDYQVR